VLAAGRRGMQRGVSRARRLMAGRGDRKRAERVPKTRESQMLRGILGECHVQVWRGDGGERRSGEGGCVGGGRLIKMLRVCYMVGC